MQNLIEHGAKPTGAVLDETGLKVKEFELKPMRDFQYRQDGESRQTIFIRAQNPRLEGTLKGEPIRDNSGALQGLAIVHPGTAQSLANLPNSRVEFAFTFTTTTKVIVKDVTSSRKDDAEDEISVGFEFWPEITTYGSFTP